MADNTFMLEIVTPEQILLRDEAQFLVVPAAEGELGVLRNHAPLLATLNIGVLRYTDGEGQIKKVAMSGGFVEVVDNTARILAETAEHAADIDVARAQSAAERARARLQAKDDDLNQTRAELALKRAITRIKATDNSKH